MPTLIHMARPPRGYPSDPGEAIDRELLELPDPPKRERTVTVLVLLLTAVAALGMIFTLRHDVAYAFSTAAPRDLGSLEAASSASLAQAPVSELVRGRAMLGAANAIRYERPLREGSFRLMPVAGRADVWIELHVPAGSENVRYVPPAEFTGRWLRFDASGPQNRGLAAAVRDVTGHDVPRDAWLLVDGDTPRAARWAVGLALLFAGFAVWNVVVAARLLRRVG